MKRFYMYGLIANLQEVSGIVVGVLICKPFGLRFGKEHRGKHFMFSHITANLAAEGVYSCWNCPVFIERKKA